MFKKKLKVEIVSISYVLIVIYSLITNFTLTHVTYVKAVVIMLLVIP